MTASRRRRRGRMARSNLEYIRGRARRRAGGRVEEVEVGPAEALLMGNDVRALLLHENMICRNSASFSLLKRLARHF